MHWPVSRLYNFPHLLKQLVITLLLHCLWRKHFVVLHVYFILPNYRHWSYDYNNSHIHPYHLKFPDERLLCSITHTCRVVATTLCKQMNHAMRLPPLSMYSVYTLTLHANYITTTTCASGRESGARAVPRATVFIQTSTCRAQKMHGRDFSAVHKIYMHVRMSLLKYQWNHVPPLAPTQSHFT